MRGLSAFFTEMKTVPDVGRLTPAAICDFTNASPNE